MKVERLKILIFLLLTVYITGGCDNLELIVTPEPEKVYGTMTDQEGNVYKTIQIGNQVWMAENLRTTKYRNGSLIPNILDDITWDNTTKGAYCHYENNDSIADVYGHLYNWYAVTDSRGLAPSGWHIPTESEWEKLAVFLGGEQTAGNKLKEKGTVHWTFPNLDATNESGFIALPCGARGEVGQYCFLGTAGYWWSSDPTNNRTAFLHGMTNHSAQFLKYTYNKEYGFSIRCLKD